MNPYNPLDTDLFPNDIWVQEVKKFKRKHPRKIYYPMSISHFEGIMNDFRQVSKSNKKRRIAIGSLVQSLIAKLPKDEAIAAIKEAERISKMNLEY